MDAFIAVSQAFLMGFNVALLLVLVTLLSLWRNNAWCRCKTPTNKPEAKQSVVVNCCDRYRQPHN